MDIAWVRDPFSIFLSNEAPLLFLSDDRPYAGAPPRRLDSPLQQGARWLCSGEQYLCSGAYRVLPTAPAIRALEAVVRYQRHPQNRLRDDQVPLKRMQEEGRVAEAQGYSTYSCAHTIRFQCMKCDT